MKPNVSKLLELISEADYHLDLAKQYLLPHTAGASLMLTLPYARDEFQNAKSSIIEAMRELKKLF